jgi:hypothetical protein
VRQKNCGRKIAAEKVWKEKCGRKIVAKKVRHKKCGRKIAAEKVRQKNCSNRTLQEEKGWLEGARIGGCSNLSVVAGEHWGLYPENWGVGASLML